MPETLNTASKSLSDVRDMGRISSQPQKGPALPTFDLELLSSRTVRQHISVVLAPRLVDNGSTSKWIYSSKEEKKNLTISENQAAYTGQAVGMQKEIRGFDLFKALNMLNLNVI